MKIEDVKDLLEELEPDKEGNGYIDCGTSTEYMDCSRYRRIIVAIKQNIALQQAIEKLTKKIEQAEKQVVESLLQVEKVKKSEKSQTDDLMFLADDFCKYKKRLKINDEIRLGNYVFKDGSYLYDPLKEAEPIELKLKITENSDKETKCPICGNSLGKYPAISREDNKTKICSNCGTLEALAAFKESLKGEKTNEQDI
jgi:predicted RNA-binding Zn-ribbon protein involved in translation (DUF1610 family)